MVELTSDNLLETISNNDRVIVQYGAGWCGNCKITKPKFKKLAAENENILFIYVDAENFPDSRKLANVSNLPTFASFLDGKLAHELQGNKEDIIKEVLKPLL